MPVLLSFLLTINPYSFIVGAPFALVLLPQYLAAFKAFRSGSFGRFRWLMTALVWFTARAIAIAPVWCLVVGLDDLDHAVDIGAAAVLIGYLGFAIVTAASHPWRAAPHTRPSVPTRTEREISPSLADFPFAAEQLPSHRRNSTRLRVWA